MDNLKKVLVEEAPIIPQPSPLHPVLQAGTQASILTYMQDSVVSDILMSVLIKLKSVDTARGPVGVKK